MKRSRATIKGHGDYKLKANSLLMGKIPSFASGQAPVRIRHKEYIGQVYQDAYGNFLNNQIYINPGNPVMCPWLSTIALQFDSYKFEGLVFYYKSFTSETTTAASGSSPALGEVVFSTDYNVTDQPFSTKVQALNMEFAEGCKASRDMIHGIECAPRHLVGDGKKYVTNIPTPGGITSTGKGDDPAKYFHAAFQYITQSAASLSAQTTGPLRDWACGELYCSYDVILEKAAPVPQSLQIQLANHSYGREIVAAGYPLTLLGTGTGNFGTLGSVTGTDPNTGIYTGSVGNDAYAVTWTGGATPVNSGVRKTPQSNFVLDFTNIDLTMPTNYIPAGAGWGTTQKTVGFDFQFPTSIQQGRFQIELVLCSTVTFTVPTPSTTNSATGIILPTPATPGAACGRNYGWIQRTAQNEIVGNDISLPTGGGVYNSNPVTIMNGVLTYSMYPVPTSTILANGSLYISFYVDIVSPGAVVSFSSGAYGAVVNTNLQWFASAAQEKFTNIRVRQINSING